MILSLAGGLLGGVSFGRIILRALLSGAIFFVLGIGVMALIDILTRKVLTQDGSVDENHLGKNIDIVHDRDTGLDSDEEQTNSGMTSMASSFFNASEKYDSEEVSDMMLMELQKEGPKNMAKSIQTILESEQG